MEFQLEKLLLGTSRGNLDDDGRLVYAGDRLVAVLVRLSPEHAELAGHWYIEVSFGVRERMEPFATLEEAASRVAQNRET